MDNRNHLPGERALRLVKLGTVADALYDGQQAYLWLGQETSLCQLRESERAEALQQYKVWTNLPSPPCGHFGYDHPSGYCLGGNYEDWLAIEAYFEKREALGHSHKDEKGGDHGGKGPWDFSSDEIFGFLVVTEPLSGREEERLLDIWKTLEIRALCLVDKTADRGMGDRTFLADFYDGLDEEHILCFAPQDIAYLPLGVFLSFHPVSNTVIWSAYGGE